MNTNFTISLFFSIIMLICLVLDTSAVFSIIDKKDGKGIVLPVIGIFFCAGALAINISLMISSWH